MPGIKVDMNYKFKNLEGKVQREIDYEKDKEGNLIRDETGRPVPKLGKSFTLKGACLNVLQEPPQEIDPRTNRPKDVKAEDKLGWADLAMRIYRSNGLVELAPEEQVLLKDFINKRYRNPLTVKQAFEILDPTTAKK